MWDTPDFRLVRPRPRRFLTRAEAAVLPLQIGSDGKARQNSSDGKYRFSRDTSGVKIPCCCQKQCCRCDTSDPTKCFGSKVKVTFSGVTVPTTCMYSIIAFSSGSSFSWGSSAVTITSCPINATFCLNEYSDYCLWYASVAASGTIGYYSINSGGILKCCDGSNPVNGLTGQNCSNYIPWQCTANIQSLWVIAGYLFDPAKGATWIVQAFLSTRAPGGPPSLFPGLDCAFQRGQAQAADFGIVFSGADFSGGVQQYSGCNDTVTFDNTATWFDSIICGASDVTFGYYQCTTIPASPSPGHSFGGSVMLTPNATC